jgi:DNA oxidative demethylase
VPIRAAKVRGHEMSVRTVCLGWHWQPYQYTREATEVNSVRVLPFPDWMIRLGRHALDVHLPIRQHRRTAASTTRT